MDEYIKRTEALEITTRTCGDYAAAWSEIRKLPAADVVPVVRCKGCKHKGWVQEPCHGKSVDYCKIWDCALQNLESTFCSYGEPRKEECV